eukprot:symbB.v1.2.034597.t1/scaffold4494.1/size38952/2
MNHGKVVYKKQKRSRGLDVLIYYWDDRDGPELCGWWFGPNVGGDQVWAYHPSRTASTPPASEWNVPHDGPIDNTFSVAMRSGSSAVAEGGQLYKSEELRSVWLIRRCLEEVSRQRILNLVKYLQELASTKEESAGWYGYELGRFMLPLHAEPSLDEGTPGSGRYGTHLVEGLDVFGARAAERWPRLRELRNSGVEGAEEMYHLQELMPQRLPAFAGQRCLFIQLQLLEMGAEVTPHRDALPYGGDLIATVVLKGSSEVRVGHQTFRVEEGDCYALAHDARYLVEHEVKAAYEDRLSLTFRYGVSSWNSLPKLQGEELRLSVDRGGPALWDC